MPLSSKIVLVAVLVVVVAAGCGRTKMEQPATERPKKFPPESAENSPSIAPRGIDTAARMDAPLPSQSVAKMATPGDVAPQKPPALNLSPLPASWELQLAQQTANLSPPGRARVILKMIPSLPPAALDTATHRAVEDLADADYAESLLPVILNPQTHGQVLSVLFSDLLERPEAVALPALLGIAKSANHPFAPAALDDLRLLLKADYANDWPRWNQAIREKLAVDH